MGQVIEEVEKWGPNGRGLPGMKNHHLPITVMTSIAMVFRWPIYRNRWFTELKNGGSFHGEL